MICIIMKQIYKEKQIRMYVMYAVVFGSLFEDTWR